MLFAALSEAADRGELILVSGGMCRWHKRRDGVIVIREILVLPGDRGDGIGTRMVQEVREKNPDALVVAKCPRLYEANIFWAQIGFKLFSQKDGINEWRLSPGSSTVPTATLPSPDPQ